MEQRNSEFAREHPIVLMVYLLGGMLVTMLTMHPVLIGLSFLTATVYSCLLWGRAMWMRLFWLMIPVLVFTVIVLPLFSHNGVTPLFYLNDMAVTLETVIYGFVMSGMLLGAFQWFQVANRLLDSEKLLYLFGRVFPSVGLLLSMVFRMIPLMGERFRQIQDGQKGMGRYGGNLSWIGRAKLLLKELSILVSWCLESSVETSISMESRGYGTGQRTSFDLFHFGSGNGVWCAVFAVLYGVTFWTIGIGCYRASYFPAVQWTAMKGKAWIGIITFLLAGMAPVVYELIRGKGKSRYAE